MLKDDVQKSEYDAMKNFRAELCKKEKLIGAYMICKDEHLYEMVTNPKITLEDIQKMPHSANIKLGEYGKILFDELMKIRNEEKSKGEHDEEDKIPF